MSDNRGTGVGFPERHHEYYLVGADLHIVVQKTLFRVHGHFFSRESPIFHRKIDPASPEHVKNGRSDSDPIMLEGVSPKEFENFLWVFYNPKYSIYEKDVDGWKDILYLADKWQFPEVKELAVRELQKKRDVDVVDKIALYQHYNVDRRHLVPLYAQLCERPHSLVRTEAEALGLDTTVLIAATRQTLRDGSLSPLSPLPASIKQDDVFRTLEESLGLDEGSTKKLGGENIIYSPMSAAINHANGNAGRGGSRGRGTGRGSGSSGPPK